MNDTYSKKHAFFLLVIFLSTVSFGFETDPPVFKEKFWEEAINNAIEERNRLYTSLAPVASGIDITKWNDGLKKRVLEYLSNSSDGKVSWYAFIQGVLLQSKSPAISQTFLNNALLYAESNPGTTWLLFVEFNRYHLYPLAENALTQLEKQMLITGARTAPIISRLLLRIGIEEKLDRNCLRALTLLNWAHRFDMHETASLRQQLGCSLPFNFSEAIQIIGRYGAVLSTSWSAQLYHFVTIYSFFRIVLFLFAVFVTFLFCFKYFPKAVHAMGHFFSGNVPLWLRTSLASCIIVSFLSFGWVVFFWIATILIWQFLSRKEMYLYCAVLGIMILTPIDALVTDRLNSATNPNKMCQALSAALNQGAGKEILPVVAKNTSNSKNMHVQTLLRIIHTLKQGNYLEARSLLGEFSPQLFHDPVAENTKGIVHFLNGSIDSAATCFKKVLSYDSTDYYAQFNLARCAILSNDASGGIDILKRAASINSVTVNRFIENNDKYFPTKWPPLRQIMFPDYSPLKFWQLLFLPVTSDGTSHRLRWGLAFFGIAPLLSSLIFLVISILLFVQHRQLDSNKKVRRLFDCKYCGKVICRRCTTGILCPSCSHTTHNLNPAESLEQSRKRILATASSIRSLRTALANLFLPGAGTFLEIQPSYGGSIIMIILSACVYTWWYLLVTMVTFNNKTLAEGVALLLLPLLFHLFTLLRFMPPVFKTIRSFTTKSGSARSI